MALTWADEHVIGVAKGADEKIVQGLRDNFNGECSEVGMYLAMSRQADREGFPEIALILKEIAFEEAEHASRFAEMLGEVVVADTRANIEKMLKGEHGACQYKKDIATWAKQQNHDAIHDSVHEMAKDEARHGKALEAALKRYFNAEVTLDEKIVEDTVICHCHQVTASAIRTAIANGASSVEEIGNATQAGTGCGGCKTKLAAML